MDAWGITGRGRTRIPYPAVSSGSTARAGARPGEPDFPTPDHIVSAAAEACHDPRALVSVAQLEAARPATSAELVEIILEEAEVAVVPGEAFGTPGYLRFSYALSDADLAEGITRIAGLVREG